MLKCVRVFAVAAVAGLLAVSIVNRSSRALAASACLKAPNAQAAQGAHWYYHVDRVNHRKCWYVDRSQINPQPEQPAATEPGTAPIEQSKPQSPFSSLMSQLSKLASPGAPQPESAGNSSMPQTNPTAVSATDDIIPKQRVGRPDPAKNAASRRTDRTAAVTPPPPRSASPITQEERDALFAQYLRWEDDREKRDALFQELPHDPTSPRAP